MQQATNIARQMVTRWGMSDKLGPVTLARSDGAIGEPETDASVPGWRPYSEDTARLIDSEIRRVLEDSYAEAVRLLQEHRRELDALASGLLARETLDAQEILQVTGLRRSAVTQAVAPLPAVAVLSTDNRHV
jgi:cell division protease FtsH